jgi:CP family cyanate transporter-like MFS transporter
MATSAIIIGIAGAVFGRGWLVVPFVVLLGLGQGSALGLAVFFFAARAADGPTAAALSGFAQGAGYLVASVGPLLLGFLHSATGAWTVPAVVLIVAGILQLTAGVLAGRNVTIGAITPAAGVVERGVASGSLG